MEKIATTLDTRLVRVKTQGVKTIADGREFYIERRFIALNWTPPDELPGIAFHGKPCTEHIAGPDMPVHCPECQNVLSYHVIAHTDMWMTGIFTCSEHPTVVWVDYYPKQAPETSWDRMNAWPRFVDSAKKIALDEESIARKDFVSNAEEVQQFIERQKTQAPLLYIMTPTGLHGL